VMHLRLPPKVVKQCSCLPFVVGHPSQPSYEGWKRGLMCRRVWSLVGSQIPLGIRPLRGNLWWLPPTVDSLALTRRRLHRGFSLTTGITRGCGFIAAGSTGTLDRPSVHRFTLRRPLPGRLNMPTAGMPVKLPG
jgi:hypothetical protein